MERFRTKTVAITGAGRGFGRGLSLSFAKLGWKVAVSDINMERASETAKLVDEAGGYGLAWRCDVTKCHELEALSEAVIKEWGSADIIINNKFSMGTVDSVCAAAMKAIRKNRLYVLPQPDAKIFWFMKRMTPGIFHNVSGFLYSRGIIDRILGVKQN